MNDLISAKEAIKISSLDNVKFLDSTFHLPNSGRNAKVEFYSKHITNAQFFDINKISDSKSKLPHMLPNSETFALLMSEMGINNNDTIVLYDNSIFFSCARAWWMFKVFGHKNVKVIDGGLFAWEKSNGQISNVPTKIKRSNYLIQENNLNMCDNLTNIKKTLGTKKSRFIIDARANDRFLGLADEPRKGLRKGHIPNSKNLPISSIFNIKSKCLKSNDELIQLFKNISLEDKNTPITTSCGSGVTACGIAFVAYKVGFKDIKVYDGSWTEWGSSKDTPIN